MRMQQRTRTNSSHRTRVFVALALITAVGVMALPQRQLSPQEIQALRTQRHLWIAAEEFRGALEEYRRDHGEWPGYPPGSSFGRTASGAWLMRHLTMATNEVGEPAPRAETGFPLGPYLPAQGVTNPINGLGDVRVLRTGQCMPTTPDGLSGWIYDPSNGELRMNASGTIPSTSIGYFEL